MKKRDWLDEVSETDFREKRNRILYQNSTLQEKRDWAVTCICKAEDLSVLYRMFGENVEEDLAALAPAIAALGKDSEALRLRSSYDLRILWRFLLRRFAFCAADAVDNALDGLGEPWYWRWWRRKDLLMPRLGMGVLLGFLVLYTSSEIWGFAHWIQGHLLQQLVLGLIPVFVFILNFMEVQEQVGRLSPYRIGLRAMFLTVIGFVWGAGGALIQFWAGQRLGGPYEHPASVALTSAFLAVGLGTVFQLFWHEGSLGDPL